MHIVKRFPAALYVLKPRGGNATGLSIGIYGRRRATDKVGIGFTGLRSCCFKAVGKAFWLKCPLGHIVLQQLNIFWGGIWKDLRHLGIREPIAALEQTTENCAIFIQYGEIPILEK
jgi:hypothetical protein